tara:strand:+ start:707 stop:964 length:258 start_codon:yes stop_codon:yes gene_type:complete
MLTKTRIVVALEEHIENSLENDPDFACTVVMRYQFELHDQKPSHEIDGVTSLTYNDDVHTDRTVELGREDENVVVRMEDIVGFYK